MRGARFFDLFTLFAALSLCFTVGFHVGRDKETAVSERAEVTVALYRAKIPDGIADTELKIDGKYECKLLELTEGELTLALFGSHAEGGFLTSGAKYLSKNQPLEVIGTDAYFYGRITRIDFSDADLDSR